ISSQLASDALGNVAAKIEVEPRSFGSARALARSVVWEWIADLQTARAQLAAVMREHGAEVPDDLPMGSALERLGGTPQFRNATTLLFVLVMISGVVASWVSLTSP